LAHRLTPATPEVAALVAALLTGDSLRSDSGRERLAADLRAVVLAVDGPCAGCGTAACTAISETAEALELASAHVEFLQRRVIGRPR
jgi:Fe-S cluster biogenesis protein NfuA